MKLQKKHIVIICIAVFVLLAVIVCVSVIKSYCNIDYTDLIDSFSDKYGVPGYVIAATIKTESSFNKDAVSYVGASGLMQLMPDTFLWLDDTFFHMGVTEDMIFIPEINMEFGTFYLSWLYERYGDWELVFAAYNAGIGRVDSWLEDSNYSKNGKLTHIPFRETEYYVFKQKIHTILYKKLFYAKG